MVKRRKVSPERGRKIRHAELIADGMDARGNPPGWYIIRPPDTVYGPFKSKEEAKGKIRRKEKDSTDVEISGVVVQVGGKKSRIEDGRYMKKMNS